MDYSCFWKLTYQEILELKRTKHEMVDAIFDVLQVNNEISLSKLQAELGTNYDSLKSYIQLIKKIQVKPRVIFEEEKNRRKVKLMKDWVDPYIRELVGYSIPPELQVLLKFLGKAAIDEKAALSQEELTRREAELLNELIQREQVKLTGDFRIYLTNLGVSVAKGAKKLYLLR